MGAPYQVKLDTSLELGPNNITTAWGPTGENLANALTLSLPVATCDYLFGNWTY